MHSIVGRTAVFFILAGLQNCVLRESDVKMISVDKVYEIVNDSLTVNNYVLFDTRGRMDYVRGHLVSAFWLTPDSLNSKIPLILNERRPLIIYDSGDGTASEQASAMLLERGIDNFFVMDGGFSKWISQGYPAAIQLVRNTSDKVHFKQKEISTQRTFELLNSPYTNYVIIDIRPYPSFSEAHIAGAISIPFEPINEFVVHVEEKDFARNKPIILYGDASSDIMSKALEVMLRNDFSQIYVLSGGFQEWASKQYPVASN